jgi:hypothetical protein
MRLQAARLCALGLALAGTVWLMAPPRALAFTEARCALLQFLLPDFRMQSCSLVEGPAKTAWRVKVSNHCYLVLAGRAVAPGHTLEAETPARAGQLLAGLVLLGCAAALLASRRVRLLRLALALGVAWTLHLGTAPLVLVGQLWGLGMPAWSEPSAEALFVGLSDFLLLGGGYGLVVLAVWPLTQSSGPRRRTSATQYALGWRERVVDRRSRLEAPARLHPAE